MNMNIEDTLVKSTHILLHPLRYRIAELLTERSMTLREITEALGEDRRLVSYHLLILEEHGFLCGELEFPKGGISSGKTTKKYGVTEKVGISYQLLILEEEGFLGDTNTYSKLPELKGKVIRKYHATEKAEEVISELKTRL